MRKDASFEQILNEKMQKKSVETQASPGASPSPQTTDYRHLSYLMGQIQSFTLKSHKVKYPRNSQYKTTQKPLDHQRKKHILNQTQSQALLFFHRFQQVLNEDFSREELKKAFRRLALMLHPDRSQGDPRYFIELKQHYQQLDLIFQSNI